MKISAYNFFLKNFILLASTFWSLITIWVNFYIRCDVGCPNFFLSFACGYVVFIALFVVKIFLPHLIVLAQVENQLTIKLIEEYYLLTILSLSIHECVMSFHLSDPLYFFFWQYFLVFRVYALHYLCQWLSFCCCFH